MTTYDNTLNHVTYSFCNKLKFIRTQTYSCLEFHLVGIEKNDLVEKFIKIPLVGSIGFAHDYKNTTLALYTSWFTTIE